MKYFLNCVIHIGLFFSSVVLIKSDESLATYHGTIKEDAMPGDQVKLDRNITVRDWDALLGDKICGYTLYKSSEKLPFRLLILDDRTGAASVLLETNEHLDYSKHPFYKFQIAARDCISENHAPRESVHIEVQSVNDVTAEQPKAKAADADDNDADVAPPSGSTWERESYTLEVEEERLYDDILQLEIEGLYGDALRRCQFYIDTPDVPFIIDNQERMGVLRNTEKLSYSRHRNYILHVRARDCGQSEQNSKPLLIDIVVKETCRATWKGIDDVIRYDAGRVIKPVAERASLELCDNTCTVARVRVTVSLHTRDVTGSVCERDTQSVQSQRSLCGASDDVVDLLPETQPGVADDVFEFDGETRAIEVPADVFEPTLQDEFSIVTWMKYTPTAQARDEHLKEHILCNSDGQVKNRHHYALYVHNCKLVLLLREEYHDGVDLQHYRPAEFRWTAPEVCDGHWHHYAINMKFPSAQLHIDGMPTGAHDGPEMIDDWALHPVAGLESTKLVVGACWMGGESRMTQHFRGHLAGLSVLNGARHSDRLLKCLTNCAERLDFHAMSDMQTGMTVSFNSVMSQITIEGERVTSVETLLRKIGYENSRLQPSDADRSVVISTQVNCTDKRQFTLNDVITPVVIVQQRDEPRRPTLVISGVTSLTTHEREFSTGVAVFSSVSIDTTDSDAAQQDEDENMIEDQGLLKKPDGKKRNIPVISAATRDLELQNCFVKVTPSMNFDNSRKERIAYPETLIDELGLEVYVKEDGLIVSGGAPLSQYEQILHQLRYYNSRADVIDYMTFTLTCTAANAEHTSNQFTVELSVVHELHDLEPEQFDLDPLLDAKVKDAEHPPVAPPVAGWPQAAYVRDDRMDEPVKRLSQNSHGSFSQGKYASSVTSGSGVGMVVIVVVCIGFLLLMIVLGVTRIHKSHKNNTESGGDEKAEMEWDNSALTITVNPMDQEGAYEDELAGVHGADSDSDDDMSSYHGDHHGVGDADDDCETSDDEPDLRELKSRGLEWDESDLSKYQCKV